MRGTATPVPAARRIAGAELFALARPPWPPPTIDRAAAGVDLGFADILDIFELSEPTTWSGNTIDAWQFVNYPSTRLSEAFEDFDTLRGTSIAPTAQGLMSTHGVDR